MDPIAEGGDVTRWRAVNLVTQGQCVKETLLSVLPEPATPSPIGSR